MAGPCGTFQARACGADLSVDLAATFPTGGYPTLRHNALRDLIAEAMDVAIPMCELSLLSSHSRVKRSLVPRLTGVRRLVWISVQGASGLGSKTHSLMLG